MLEEILKSEDYGVLRSYSGTEALLLLERHRPDLILLDLMMPEPSGEQEQVLEKMQECLCAVKKLLLYYYKRIVGEKVKEKLVVKPRKEY